jgi:c-di-GMP-binding flagellar brake protein YcgR
MNELLEKNQLISIVPKNFKNSNKGKVLDIMNTCFTLKLEHEPQDLLPKKIMEFYSTTKNGTLYFSSSIVKVDGDVLVVLMPRKHRFLQRRAFTRIKFIQDLDLKLNGKSINASSLDLSAGGIKLKTNEHIELNSEYDLRINLIKDNYINCKYEPLKIEKTDDGNYILAGRFKNLNKIERMKVVQFCIRKDIENKNR